jgi:hypothetical protein
MLMSNQSRASSRVAMIASSALVLSAAAAGAPAGAAAPAPQFRTPVTYATPGYDGLAAGDFDGDGKIDLAETAYNSSRVYTLRGNGDGTFAAAVQRAAVSSAGRLFTTRFNADAADDLLVASYSFTTVALLGTPSTGALTPAPGAAAAASFDGSLWSLADLDADGNLDLLVQGSYNQLVTIRGTGNGGFATARSTYPVGYALRPRAADFNRDGKLDVIVGSAGGEAHVFLGDGTGALEKKSVVTLPNLAYAMGFAIADFNGDGIPDFATGYGSSLKWAAGNGDGTFTATGGAENAGGAYEAADFDLDGDADLLTLDGRRVGLLRGRGDGTFDPVEFTTLNTATTDLSRYLTVADFDGNGALDVATLSDSGVINVLINNVPEPAALALALPAALLLRPRERRARAR